MAAQASMQLISKLSFDKQGEILAAGYNSGNLVLFHYQPYGSESLADQLNSGSGTQEDVEMAESSQLVRE